MIIIVPDYGLPGSISVGIILVWFRGKSKSSFSEVPVKGSLEKQWLLFGHRSIPGPITVAREWSEWIA